MKKNNEKDYYKKVKDWNFKNFKIKTEKLTNWDIYEILKKVTDKTSKILDLGTGGGEKLLSSFPKYALEILGTDYSEDMIETANKNLKKSGLKNISFKIMNNLEMNVLDDYYDVVVARNTITDPIQIFKSLKKGGILLIHGVDKYDCLELKMIFGRGQALNNKKPISIVDYEHVLKAGFNEVELVPIHVREYFKNRELLKRFLLKVPILNDFTKEENTIEDDKLDEYIKRNTTKKGIVLYRRYYGIFAKK